MKETFLHLRRLWLPSAAGVAGSLLLTACASTPPAPTAGLVEAHSAIANAEKADAGRYAAPELSEAREKLAAAEGAVTNKQMVSAQRFAEQAIVEANLASAKAREAKATAVNDEMKHSNEALSEELQRSTEGQP